MEFRILGPLQVRADGQAVALPGAKPRAVLAVLLLHANRPVSPERLAVALWGEDAPAGAVNTVQVHVSRLRKALPDPGALVTTPGGYELRVDPERVDAHRFERLAGEGRAELAAGRVQRAAALLEDAQSLWHGRPLADLAFEPFAQREIARLEDLRAAALEELADARLALGRHAEVVGDLERLVAEYPYRERLRAQLMLALYRCDRQADALLAYQDARRALVDELGIEPGERLRALERAILAQDPALAPPDDATFDPPGAARRQPDDATPDPLGVARRPADDATPDPPRAARRLVTVVSAHLAASAGRLDPESAHDLLARFADVCGAVAERHGGTVEGFAGDTLVAVFGRLEVHEDDALRAVRAAVDMREAAAGLGADVHIGAESGEVFVDERFAAGEAFNRAARLGATAGQDEILIGADLHRLLGAAVRAEPAPLGWRLIEIDEEPAPAGTPFVGRRRELDALLAAFARTREERCCAAVTVVGPAGMGKSRLARELAGELAEHAAVVTGRCPAYGDGAAHRALAEIVAQLAGGDPRERVRELLDDDEPLAQVVLAAIGLSDGTSQPGEASWAVRRMFERVASERPLVVIVEDLHWAEPTLLDLLEYVLALSSGHAILLVCLARHDFLEARPAWAAPQPNRELLELDALSAEEARQLVEHAGLRDGTTARIVETAEGNPLFLEQLVAVGADDDALPSSIHAVLAARLDRLPRAERALLEEASVQGRTFFAGALDAETQLLVPLVGRRLIRREPSALAGEDAFRFGHVLIREAAYRGVPKQRRAELHERLARWFETRAGTEGETVGHHLAEACRHRAELGRPDPELAREAAERLAAAADHALVRGESAAAVRLLERAASLEPDGELLPQLGAALFEAGRKTDAIHVLDEAIASAAEPRLRARAQVERELVRLETETGAQDVTDAVPLLDGDDHGLCRLWLLRGQLAWHAGRVQTADDAWQEAADTAATRDRLEIIGWRAMAAVLGPAPVEEAIRRCETFRRLAQESPLATASTLNPLALLHAMTGDFETAGRLVEEASEALRDLGGLSAGVSHLEASVWLLAARPELAEAALRADVEGLASMSGGSALATTTALLAQALFDQGRDSEALEMCRTTERHAAPGDTVTQAIWRGVQAKVQQDVSLAREAVALVEPTDLLSTRGDAMLDLAHVLHTCDRAEEADRMTRAGLALYEQKGNRAAAARARSRLSQRQGGS